MKLYLVTQLTMLTFGLLLSRVGFRLTQTPRVAEPLEGDLMLRFRAPSLVRMKVTNPFVKGF